MRCICSTHSVTRCVLGLPGLSGDHVQRNRRPRAVERVRGADLRKAHFVQATV